MATDPNPIIINITDTIGTLRKKINTLSTNVGGVGSINDQGDGDYSSITATVNTLIERSKPSTIRNMVEVTAANSSHTQLNYNPLTGVFNFISNNIEVADIPDLPANKITSGVLNASLIPDINAGKITGTIVSDQLPTVLADIVDAAQESGNIFAPLVSPALTGIPTAPTATENTNTTQIATTAFVATSFAPLASPVLTGIPIAPTAAEDTNTTQIATTAFVTAAISGSGHLEPDGNGSQLTNLNAAELTGDLPAIDGSNLTGIQKYRAFRLNGSGTYNPSSDVTAFSVFVIGATGAKGGDSEHGGGGGCGGAGYSEKHYSSPASSYSYAVGAGGFSGAGTTTFGVISVTKSGSGQTGDYGGTGGSGGVGSNGDFNASGGTGGNGGGGAGGNGGAGSRAGDGGNGMGGRGGGTGGNNANNSNPGAAATSEATGVISIPTEIVPDARKTFSAGFDYDEGGNGAGAMITNGLIFPYADLLPNAGGVASSDGRIVILEYLS